MVASYISLVEATLRMDNSSLTSEIRGDGDGGGGSGGRGRGSGCR